MFERFTDRARRVLVLAQEEARLLEHNFIGTEHLLLGLIHEGEGVAAKSLSAHGVTLEAVREKVCQAVGANGIQPVPGSPPFTAGAKMALELSLREALGLGHSYIGTEHVLLGIVREGEGVGAQVLREMGVDLAKMRATVIQIIKGVDPETGAQPEAGTLTADEHKALDLSGRLGKAIRAIIEANRGEQADEDWREARAHIHALQRMIQGNAAARAYPDRYRLLGGWQQTESRDEP